MMQSMTGFGSAEKNGYRVEIRSLNHKFLDIFIKAPVSLNQFETEFRSAIKERFSRGKFDISISVSEHVQADLEINTEFVGKIYSALKRMQEGLSIPGELDINAMTNFREMFIEINQKYDINMIKDVFAQAADALYQMRIKEGEALAADLYRMTDSLNALNDKIKNSYSRVLFDIMERFNDRLKTILEGKDIDNNRILQEAAIIAMKSDISEETARIESHLGQFREILSVSDIIGRKLDFILQELNREVNTIASKSPDYSISSLAVEMKTEIEKIREQVQNIQ